MASSFRTELAPPFTAPDSRAPAAPTSEAAPTHVIIRGRRNEPAGRWTGLGVVIAIHLVALFALLQYEPARQALTSIAPIMVDIITPPKLEEPPPPPPPPPPRAQPKPRLEPLKTAEPPPIIAAPAQAPTEFVAPPPAPPAPPVEVAAVATPTPPAPSVAPPVTPPSFDAAYLKNEPPRYPNASRRMSETGRVVLRVLVSSTGTPDKVELGTTSGFERLDTAALETVRNWKFVPAHQAGKPVAAWVQVPIVFSLAR